jgi:hypothetical protein
LKRIKRKHTYSELMKFYQPVMFTLKLIRSREIHRLENLRKYGPTSITYHWFRESLWPYFKLYIPTLTQERTKEMLAECCDKKKEREKNKQYHEHGRWALGNGKQLSLVRTFNMQRIYPLKPERYQALAEKVYDDRGKPTFDLKVITGVKWGDPVTKRKVHHGGIYNKILERWVGVYIGRTHGETRRGAQRMVGPLNPEYGIEVNNGGYALMVGVNE